MFRYADANQQLFTENGDLCDRGCYKRFSTWRRCEIALACHHRIMSDHPKSYMGLVECSVGCSLEQEVRNGFENAWSKENHRYITQSKK
jgi:hypothetical protein